MTNVAITDLRIIKSIDDDTPQIGQEVTWTITVNNDTTTHADNVSVSDLIPPGMQYVSAQASSGLFDEDTGTWPLGGLAGGAEATATIKMVVTDANYHIINNATVHTDTHDCNPSNDTNPVKVVPWEPTQADLSLVKTVDDPTPEVGSVVEWTVTLSNSGPDTAWGTVVNETLPDGVTFVGARATTGTYDFASGVWDVGDLANGASAEMVISTSIDSDAAAHYVNQAVASSITYDPNEANNTGEATAIVSADNSQNGGDEGKDEHQGHGGGKDGHEGHGGGKGGKGGKDGHEGHGGGRGGKDGHEHGPSPVACCCACDKQEETGADLQIIKLVDNPTPNLNSEVVWTLLVTNNGPEDAVNVVVNDNLPAGVEYVSDTTTMGAFNLDAGTWVIGDLANGASAMLQVKTIATDAAAVQTNVAIVGSDTDDSNPANDVAIDSIDAVNADLEITKSVDKPAPDLGAEVTWTIEVKNNGPDTAENVVVKDLMPVGTTLISLSDNLIFDANGSVSLGDIAPEEVVSIDITVTVNDADGPRVNTASVSSDTYDDNLDNNSDQAQTDAVAADLELTKGVIPGTAAQGETVEWTIEVINKGPDAATGVTVEDILPAGVSYVSDSAGGSVPHLAFLGDSWMDPTFLPEAIVEPVTRHIADAHGGATVSNHAVSGYTVADMLADANWQPVLDANNPNTIFVEFGVNEFNTNVDPVEYQANLSELFGILVTEYSETDVVFLIPAQTAPVNPEYEWSQYVDAAVAATSDADVQSINLGDVIPPYDAASDLWHDALHISESAASVVTDAVSGGYTYPEAVFNPGTAIWNIGALAVDETVSLTIDAIVTDIGELKNVAQVSASNQFDPDSTPGNDTGDQSEDDEDSALLSVLPVDLELTEVVSNTTPEVGEDITFTFTVTNTSTVTATGVTVKSQLPAHFDNEELTFVSSDDAELMSDPSSVWDIGTVLPGESKVLNVVATVETAGTLDNFAQILTTDQDDIDSTPGNVMAGGGVQPSEDDEAIVSITVPDPNPVPVAVPDSYAVELSDVKLNAVIMVDHSGSMGGDTVDQNPSGLAGDITGLDGNPTSRLQVIREAVMEFSQREQVGEIKVLGFDGTAAATSPDDPAPFDPSYASMPHDNVSQWFDVSGAAPNSGLETYLDSLRASGFTNYTEALELSQQYYELDVDGNGDPAPSGLVNYYFLTDGQPLSSNATSPTPDAAALEAWETFVVDNFNEAYGIGFGGATDPANLPNIDLVSHKDDANETRDIGGQTRSEENTIVTAEATDIPAELFKTIVEPVSENVFANDSIGNDGFQGSNTVTSITIGSTTHLASDGAFAGFLPSGAYLEFNLADGSFDYYPSFTDQLFTETIEYTITDGTGDIATAEVTIDVTPPPPLVAFTLFSDQPVSGSALVADNDDLFVSGEMVAVQLQELADSAPASDGLYDSQLYDAMSLVV